MKTVKKLSVLLVMTLLLCTLFTGCNDWYEYSSSWVYDSDGNVYTDDENGGYTDTQNGTGDGKDSNTATSGSGKNSGSGNGSGGNATNTAKNKKDYLDDNLDDWSNVFARGADLIFDGNKPAMFEGDFSRARRGGDKDCWISWKFDAGITEFGVVTYWDTTVRNITVSVSADNKAWKELKDGKTSDIDIGYGWTKRVFKFYNIDKSNKYVKIDLGSTPKGDHVHSPNISRVRINNIDKMDDPNRFLEGRNAATFYVDSKKGSDNNSGLSESKPLKSLNAISKRYFQPGDKILFKSGSTFNGTVNLNGMGSAAAPIKIGTYGGKEKAKISARGGNAVCLKMQYVTVENLEITNATGLEGISIVPIKTGANNNITIKNCYIHNINTKQESFAPGLYDTGGIIVTVDGLEPTWINNLVIENNVIEKTSRCGIFMSSEWAFRPGTWGREGFYKSDTSGWYPYTNTVIRNNTVNECYGDSILVTCANNTLIEKNTVTNGFNNTKVTNIACASVWDNNTNNSTFQYNDISYTHLPSGCADGEALDIDIANVRTVMQYNYTHDNEGGMLLMCNNDEGAKISKDHIIRFNLSVNDGHTNKAHAVFMIEGKNPNSKIYNNTVYLGGITDTVVKHYSSMGGGATENISFMNNIFCGASGKAFNLNSIADNAVWKNCVFDNNVLFNIGTKNTPSGVTVSKTVDKDPNFKNASISLKNAKRSEVVSAFTPGNKIEGATNIGDNGGKDINGTSFSKIDFYGCVKY